MVALILLIFLSVGLYMWNKRNKHTKEQKEQLKKKLQFLLKQNDRKRI